MSAPGVTTRTASTARGPVIFTESRDFARLPVVQEQNETGANPYDVGLFGFDAGSPQDLPNPLAGVARPPDQIHLPRAGSILPHHGAVQFGAGLFDAGAGVGLDLPSGQHGLFFRPG